MRMEIEIVILEPIYSPHVTVFWGISCLYAAHKLISLYIYTNKRFIPNVNMEG